MSVYEPDNELFYHPTMRYLVSTTRVHLVALLGETVNERFAGKRDGDVVIVWPSGTNDDVWVVWTNNVDAFRRFQRELTRSEHPNARLLDRPYALDTQGE